MGYRCQLTVVRYSRHSEDVFRWLKATGLSHRMDIPVFLPKCGSPVTIRHVLCRTGQESQRISSLIFPTMAARHGDFNYGSYIACFEISSSYIRYMVHQMGSNWGCHYSVHCSKLGKIQDCQYWVDELDRQFSEKNTNDL